MAEQIYLFNDDGVKYLYHKIYEANIERELEKLLPETGVINDIVLHWSAGSYSQMYQHYAVNITNDAIAVVDKSKFLSWREFSHTWHRNSGKLGISFCAMYDLKKAPVTKLQIEMMVKTLTIICKKFKLNPTNDIQSHGYWAKQDNYSHLRWDIDLIVNFNNKKQTLTSYIKERVQEELTTVHKIISPVTTIVKSVPLPDKHVTNTSFVDVKTTDWFSYQTELIKKLGIMAGDTSTGKSLFHPMDNVTRKEIAAVFSKLIQYIEKKTGKKLPDLKKFTVDYKDVVNKDWYYESVKDLSEKSILSGYNMNGDTYFKPALELTRAEFCTLLVNFIEYLETQKLITTDIKTPIKYEEVFQDVDNKHWAWFNIMWIIKKSILIGYKTEQGSFFKPDEKIRRCECTVGIYKLIKYFVSAKVITETL